ncbi:MAG: hypothetical protein QOH28_3986 [Actinomycetota bacterium]|jgi:hypothetical protein|nr:hypothetical protein [Actinomycetota bacterium]
MEARELASNLEFWAGRARNGGAGEDRRRLRPSFGRRRRNRRPFRRPRFGPPSFSRSSFGRGRARPLAAFALLAGLTAAWVVAGHRARTSAAGDAPAALASPSFVSAPSNVAPSNVASTAATTTVPRTRDCVGLSVARREVRCVIDGIDVDVRLYAPGTVAAAYRRAAGADVAARSGSPACARGLPDERAWSSAALPRAGLGRYRCLFERERAAMWWTNGDRLVHAVARGGDLAALFSWWRAHPSE